MSGDYSFEDYTDNWSNWQNKFPTLPAGAQGDVGFAVPNSDGTWNTNYPITPGPNSPAQPGSTGLAVGGWTASQPGGGLYSILTEGTGSPLTPAQLTLINSILSAATQNGYTNVILDYENYSNPAPNPDIYTNFMEALGNALHAKGITLEMAMSPDPVNQQYYNLQDLVSSGAVDHFQVMCYDYAMGQGSPVTVEANSGVLKTYQFLEQLAKVIPLEKMTIGVAFYGISYTVQPGLDIDKALKAGGLTGQYTDPQSPIISDDDILKAIGDWKNPTPPWQLANDGSTPPNYYYYNSQTGQLISAFPPDSITDFASMIRQNFPNVAGFFAWDADYNASGTMMQDLMQAFYQKPLDVSTYTQEIKSWANWLATQGVTAAWIQQFLAGLGKVQTLSDLVAFLNLQLNPSPSYKDMYMTAGLLKGSPGGEVHNLLETLFYQYSNLTALTPLGMQPLQPPTFADTALAQALAWNPDSAGGDFLRTWLINQLQQSGSQYSETDLDKLIYGPQGPKYPQPLSQADSTVFTNITGAWL